MSAWIPLVGCVAGLAIAISAGLCHGQKKTPPAQEIDHHQSDRFRNPYIEPLRGTIFTFMKMRVFGDEPWADQEAQKGRIPVATTFRDLKLDSDGPRVTWIGHSTFLVSLHGLNLLTDPVFSRRVSPYSFVGPKRLAPLPYQLEDLPDIDYVVISHNHYDHLDKATIRQLGDHPMYLVPLGLKDWFVKVGIDSTRVVELDWGESWQGEGIQLTATPSQHWSGRGLWDRNKSLWASWLVNFNDFTLWFGGDTGYNPVQFRDIGNRYPGIDLAFIPIGAYEPRWFMQAQHIDPAEAITIHKEIGAAQSIGMHWGTFQLTAENLDDPVKTLRRLREEENIREQEFFTLSIGETWFPQSDQALPGNSFEGVSAGPPPAE